MPRKSWWKRLPFGVRMTVGTSALLMLVGGGVAGVAALVDERPTVVTAAPADLAAPRFPAVLADGSGPSDGAAPEVAPSADPEPDSQRAPGIAIGPTTGKSRADVKVKDPEPTSTGTEVKRATVPEPRHPAPAPHRPAPVTPATTTPPPSPTQARPVITTRTEVETRSIPFRTRLVRDPKLPWGAKDVQSEGEAGVRSLRYLVTITDGKQTGRRLLDSTVTKRPAHRVVAIGVEPVVGPAAEPDAEPDAEPAAEPDADQPDRAVDDQWGCDEICVPFGRSSTCREDTQHHGGEHYGDKHDGAQHGGDKGGGEGDKGGGEGDKGEDDGGGGAGMIVLDDPVISNEDLGLPAGHDWDC